MRRILFFAALVLYITTASAISFNNLGSTLNVVSNEFVTTLAVEITTSVPTIVITPKDGADARIIKFDGTSLSIDSSNFNEESGASQAVSLNPQFLTMFIAIITLGAFSFKVGIRSFLMIGLVTAILCLQAPIYTQAQTQGSFDIVLQIPSNFSFDHLNIEMELGSINLSFLEVDVLEVTIGSLGSGTGGVTIASLGVATSASIQSNGPINVGAVYLLSTVVNFDFISDGNVNLTFSTFRGTVHLNHTDTSVLNLIGSFCQWQQQSSNYQFGDCESATGSNELRISSGGNIDVNFGEFCPANYRDPVAVDRVPASPAVTSTVPEATFSFGNFSKWFYRETWAGNMANLTQNGDEFVVTQGNSSVWNENVFWMVCPDCLPYLRPNVNYNFSMDFKQAGSNPNINASSSNIVSIQLVIIKNIGWPNGYSILPNITSYPAKILAVSNFTSPFNVTQYQNYATLFSVAESLWTGEFAWDKRSGSTTNLNKKHAFLGIRVQLYTANAGSPTFYFKNFQMTKDEESYQPSSMLGSVVSELVTIRKPDWIDESSNRTNCPWDEENLLPWHDPATWGGVVPAPSSVITLPANAKVLVASCSLDRTATYNQIVVPYGSELIFSDASIDLKIGSIVVNGKLRIGSSTCRVFSEMTFTFVGPSTTSDIMGGNMGAKGIGVSPSGSIDVHAKLYQNTWTRLKATAWPGDDRVIIQDPVNWEVGQKVFVTTTFMMDEWWNQNEVLEIRAVSGNVVQFTKPLKYYHYGGIEYQAEIGLISRRVVFQGDDQSEDNAFGGHVIVRGEGRFSGVQAFRMGQKNRIARYPFHFHMMDEASESFVQDCSCLHTYFRCVTVHRTNSSLVTRNVAFDVTGHCYYLEDGVEEKNTFTYNLAAFVHVIGTPAAGPGQDGQYFNQSINLSQPADAAAAGFYITNAYNIYIGNAASGGWTGFSFPNLPLPVGASAGEMMDPSARPNLIFESNTAHSTGYEWSSGSCIYTGGKLWISNSSSGALSYTNGRFSRQTRIPGSSETYDPVNLKWNAGGTPLWMKFNNTRSALCNAGFNHWGDRLDIWSYEGHDVGRSATVFGESSIVNALVEGFSANPITGQVDAQGFQFYDTSVKSILVDVAFRNFQPRVPTPSDKYSDNYIIISMTHSDKFKPQGISAAKNITHINVNRTMFLGHKVENTGSSRYFNFIDWDGSASGSTGPSIVGSNWNWWYLNTTCRKEWNVWVCPKTADNEIANLNIFWNGTEADCVEPPHGNSTWIGNISMWGDGISTERWHPFTTCPGVTGVTNKGWYFWMPQGSPRDMTIYTMLIPNNQSIYFAARYPNTTTFNISTDYKWGSTGDGPVTRAANFTEMKNSNGNKYFWDNNYLILKLVNKVIPNPPFYQRGGVKVYTVQNAFRYIVNATNCGGSGRFCDFADNQIPSYLVV